MLEAPRVAGPDGPVAELLERIAPHADLARPGLPAIAEALMALAADHDYLAPHIARLGDFSGAHPLHVPPSGPRLSLVHRRAGQMSAVHDHGVWVALAPIVGVETHRRYRPLTRSDRAVLHVAEERPLGPAECVTLQPPDDIHDHGHLSGRGDAAWVLILLGDDQFQRRRTEWHPRTGRSRVLEPGDQGRWLASEPFPG